MPSQENSAIPLTEEMDAHAKLLNVLDGTKKGDQGEHATPTAKEASDGESCLAHATFVRFLMDSPEKLGLRKLQVYQVT